MSPMPIPISFSSLICGLCLMIKLIFTGDSWHSRVNLNRYSFSQKTVYNRNDHTRDDTRTWKPNPVHLNEKGMLLFQRELRKHIESAVDLKFMQKDKFPVPMMPEEWLRFRKMARSYHFEPAFKVTNYAEGANRDDQLIPYNGSQISAIIFEADIF